MAAMAEVIPLLESADYFKQWELMSSDSKDTFFPLTREEQTCTLFEYMVHVGAIDESSLSENLPSTSNDESQDVSVSDIDDCEEGETLETFKVVKEKEPLKLRKYQEELAEEALKGHNVIICSPTNSGKTLVAVDIIDQHLKQDKQEGERERKVAFFARTVPLVIQQYKKLAGYLPYKVDYMTGSKNTSLKLHDILPDVQVIVMTPRILENHLKWGTVPDLGLFSLIVFDECHHARKADPFNTLMLLYHKTRKEKPYIKLPQVIGLTATIGVEEANTLTKAVDAILEVCGNLDVNGISTVRRNIEELQEAVPELLDDTIDELKELDLYGTKKIKDVMATLEGLAVNQEKELKKCYNQINLMSRIPQKKKPDYEKWVIEVITTLRCLPKQKKAAVPAMSLIIIAEYLKAYNIALQKCDLLHIQDVMEYLKKIFDAKYRLNVQPVPIGHECNELFRELYDYIQTNMDEKNENLEKLKSNLLDCLKSSTRQPSASRGIIFVRTRAVAKGLAAWLKKCRTELQGVKTEVFTGTSASKEHGGMSQGLQTAVLERFRSGETQILVATSVAEEGLDIPDCNFVIRYNHVCNEVKAVQIRGRVRKAGGKAFLIAMKEICNKERNNKNKEKLMKAAIAEVQSMSKEEIEEHNKKHQTDILKLQQEPKKVQPKKIPFTMECSQCGGAPVEGADIKIVLDAHRVVVKSDIFKHVKVLPRQDNKTFDDIRMIGKVYCRHEIPNQEGVLCFNKLGSLIIYAGTPFVIFGLSRERPLTFVEKAGRKAYKGWKEVPYAIDTISPDDLDRYTDVKDPRVSFAKPALNMQPTNAELVAGASFVNMHQLRITEDYGQTGDAGDIIASDELNKKLQDVMAVFNEPLSGYSDINFLPTDKSTFSLLKSDDSTQ